MAGEVDVWEQLRATFPADEIERLPKPLYKNAEKGRCDDCGGWHGLPAVHLSYVGHAGLTMRLNEVVGPTGWNWEPLARTEFGTPLFTDGGLWIKLTILDHTKIGFGDPGFSSGPTAVKETIGDALRNAAMRFGIATYLWSKSDKAQAQATQNGADDEPTPQPQTVPNGGQSRDRPAWEDARVEDKHLAALFATMADANLPAKTDEERAQRRTEVGQIIGRDLDSFKDLTVREFKIVMDRLKAIIDRINTPQGEDS